MMMLMMTMVVMVAGLLFSVWLLKFSRSTPQLRGLCKDIMKLLSVLSPQLLR